MTPKLLAYGPPADIATLAAKLNRQFDGQVVFQGTITSDALADAEAAWAIGRFPTSGELCVSMALMPDGDAHQFWQAARGAQDAYWTSALTALAPLKPAYIRQDWEPNVAGTTRDASSDPPDAKTMRDRATARVRTILPGTRVVYCPGAGLGTVDAEAWAPADFDVLGLDLYHTGNADPAANWTWLTGGPRMLDDWAAWAKARGKPLALPEWGQAPGIDDPTFIADVAAWIAAHDVEFHSIFLANGNGVLDKPLSLTAFVKAFGAPAEAVAPPAPPSPTKAQAAAAWALWMRRLGWQGACSQADADAAMATVQAFFAAP